MTGEVYKVLIVDDKRVECIDQIDGFSLEIDGSHYHVYEEDGGTHVDLVMNDDKSFFAEREYIGQVNESWTGDEEEAARFIILFWNGDAE